MDFEKESLAYHRRAPRGKIGIYNKKPLDTIEDLSLAYSPGVAGPCREIAKNEDLSFQYTSRANLIAVISNGTAVLGLGNIGPYAAKPVMEGKAMLFKKFADIDVFDLEVKAENPDEMIAIVKALEPSFGGINLEDIKAPDCFYIEEELKKSMSIPVFHDDQHGTAIIASSAFLNALQLTGRKIEDTKVVFSGAGAAAIACADLFIKLGVQPKNLLMCDSSGVLTKKRKDLNVYKEKFAQDVPFETLEEAIKEADAFVGVSQADVFTAPMLKSMREHPIVFALSNPNPEINPELAHRTRSDVILATGRSDYPNQVNNVLGFPYIFRGALDVKASEINDAMKLAAVRAIADLAKEDVPEDVLAVYRSSSSYVFGKDYLIPKPVDQRVLLRVAPAVALAAMETGVARYHVDIEEYKEQIHQILSPARRLVREARKRIKAKSLERGRKPRVLVTFSHEDTVLQAVKEVSDSGEIDLVILGEARVIQKKIDRLGLKDLSRVEIIDYKNQLHLYEEKFSEILKEKKYSKEQLENYLQDENYFGALKLSLGAVDAMVTGINRSYRECVRPILRVLQKNKEEILSGVYTLILEDKVKFFSDCTINLNPTAEELARIALSAVKLAKSYTKEPLRVAMLSFSSFGDSPSQETELVAEATRLIRKKDPSIEVDGEMQVDVALNKEFRRREFPLCKLTGDANVLIFPNLSSANIGYKLLNHLAGASPIGPILTGLSKPANVMQRSATVRELVHMIYMTADRVS
jgi:malate dehydrogenase (oxaloacetate-decarboxylating)(NADP+)